MAFDLATLGERLRDARTNSGFTQEAAADAIGVPRTAIVHIEAGNRSVSTVELAEFARLYNRKVAEFFEEDGEREDDLLVVLGRVDATFTDNPEMNREISRVVDLCRAGIELQKLVGGRARSTPPDYELSDPKTVAEAAEQGEMIAVQERKRLDLAAVPICDVSDVLASQGIWASGAILPDEMSGLFIQHPSIGIVVLVNFIHPRARKRFSYAHEYAHALLDRKRNAAVTTTKNRHEFIERRANAFAATFLMPKTGVMSVLHGLDKGGPSRHVYHVYDVAGDDLTEAKARSRPGSQEITFKDVALLAAHFSVSYQAACYRLSDLSIVNRTELKELLESEPLGEDYLKLMEAFDEIGGKDKGKPDKELRNQILQITVEAYRLGEISRGRLLDLCKKMGFPGREVLDLANAAKD